MHGQNHITNCVLIFSKIFVWKISLSKKNFCDIVSKTHIDLRIKYPLFLSDFNETWIFSTEFRKVFNAKFHEDPSRHDYANSRFLLFSECAPKPNNFPTHGFQRIFSYIRKYIVLRNSTNGVCISYCGYFTVLLITPSIRRHSRSKRMSKWQSWGYRGVILEYSW